MDKKILLQNLADSLAERAGITKRKAEAFVRSFFEITEEALVNDGQVKVKNFGTTKIVNVSNRESININTGERFQIEGHAKITFVPDALFRDLVNRPFAHFTTIILDDEIESNDLIDSNEAEDCNEAENATDTTSPTPNPEEKALPAETPTLDNQHVIPTTENIEHVEEVTPAQDEEPAEDVEPAQDEEPSEEEEPANEEEEEEEEEEEKDDNITEPITTTAPVEGKSTPIIINNTIPEPRYNWWRAAFTALVMLVIALLSYFAGYFRIFCPCSIFDVDLDAVATENITESERQETDSIAKVKADSIAKVKADSIAKVKADSTMAANKAAQEAANKAAQEAMEKRSQRAQDLENAQKYQQLPGSSYLIVGTMQTIHVRRGENLFMIAKRYYGLKDFARYITLYNNIENPNHVTVGQSIRLPRLILRDTK